MLLTLVVQNWGTEEVAAWLDLLNLGEYKEIFVRHDVRGAELLHLERRDLKVFFSLRFSLAFDIFRAMQNLFSCEPSVMCFRLGLHYATVRSPLTFVCSLTLSCASAVRMSAVFLCRDHFLTLTAEAQHAPRNLSLYPLVWLSLSSRFQVGHVSTTS